MMNFIQIIIVSFPMPPEFCSVILFTNMLPSTVLSVLWLFFLSQFSCLTTVKKLCIHTFPHRYPPRYFCLYTAWKPRNFQWQYSHITPLSKSNCTDQKLILKWKRPVTDIASSLNSSVLIGERLLCVMNVVFTFFQVYNQLREIIVKKIK